MEPEVKKIALKDNGGRRSGLERRLYAYTFHFPERRSGLDRRTGKDRRQKQRFVFVVAPSSPG
jgi:hypothetical protein